MSKSLSWTSVLLSSLYKHGVTHAVISPGSRSTPLALAAAIHPGIRKYVVLDERSAAFIALGIGKSTGIPAVLICTSGTAVANYFPAVIEAKESGVPVIILSADRPPHLRNLGSSQTIDQLKIFGNQTVFFHEAGEPTEYKSDLKRIAYAAKQAVQYSTDCGGAAHINLPFRKPLEPAAGLLNVEKEKLAELPAERRDPYPASVNKVTPDEKIRKIISSSKRPLLIAGPSNPHQALSRQAEQLAGDLRAPMLAEPGSQFGYGQHSVIRFDQFLRNTKIQHQLRPDLVIRFGDQPYSKSLLLALVAWNEVPVIQITARRASQDHEMMISHRILCHKPDTLSLENIRLNAESNWIEKWKEAEKTAEENLQRNLNSSNEMTDGHVFSHFSKQIPDEWNVMLSNSLSVRDMLTFGKPLRNQFVNRGAAGIDGILSTALGIHFSSEKGTCCFLGDLAFLHDSNALYTLQQAREHPFVAVVINNQGGNIFRLLPVFGDKKRAVPQELYQTYFETPQKTSIEFLAKASGIGYCKIESLSDLKKTELSSIEKPAVVECKTHPDAGMKLRQKLRNA